MNTSSYTIIIPSLNPDEKLTETVRSLISLGFTDIILVNDGSAPSCVPNFPAELPECTLLTHEVNRGKGAALKTAFRYYLESGRTTHGVITVDGDGQHKAEDVLRCAEKMAKEEALVLGVRNFNGDNIPLRSRFGNKTTSLVFRLFCGLKISDTQTGLRAIPAKHLEKMLHIDGDRYEYETNMLLQLKSMGIPTAEIPIETVYIEENKTSHFRPLRDSMRIYGLIFKFIFSSLLSSVIDLGLFFLLSLFMPALFGALSDAICTVIARVISSAVNFTLNKKTVFRSSASLKTSLIRYYILAAVILLLSSVSISAVSVLFSLTDGRYALLKTACKFCIDSVLFLISFRAQREWVFASGKAPEANTDR